MTLLNRHVSTVQDIGKLGKLCAVLVAHRGKDIIELERMQNRLRMLPALDGLSYEEGWDYFLNSAEDWVIIEV